MTRVGRQRQSHAPPYAPLIRHRWVWRQASDFVRDEHGAGRGRCAESRNFHVALGSATAAVNDEAAGERDHGFCLVTVLLRAQQRGSQADSSDSSWADKEVAVAL